MAAHNEDLVSALECSLQVNSPIFFNCKDSVIGPYIIILQKKTNIFLQACVSLLVTDNAEKDSEKAVVNKSGKFCMSGTCTITFK